MEEKEIVGVVEFPSCDGRTTERRKVRTRIPSEGKITGELLRSELLRQVGYDDVTSQAKLTVEIYDSSRCEFVSLSSPEWKEEDVTMIFGKRVRCSISIEDTSEQGGRLALMGRFIPYDTAKGIKLAGKLVLVKERFNIAGAGTGLNVWDGAILLAKYLEYQPEMVRSRRVLELGAGCGLVGIAAGLLGAAHTILTDLPYALPLMLENVDRHRNEVFERGCEQVKCRSCDWFNPPTMAELGASIAAADTAVHPWQADVILVADCVWIEELVAPLLSTISRYLKEAKTPLEVVFSYQQRGKRAHDEFYGGLQDIFSSINCVELSTFELKADCLSILVCKSSPTR